MTDTARYADIVLPATMFLEHDDIYTASAHQYLQFAPKTIDPPEGCRSNHDVICALARRLGAEHRGLRHEPTRDHRRDLARLGAGNARGARGRALARLPAAVRGRAFPRRLCPFRRQVSFPRRLAERALRQRRPARPLARPALPARPLGRSTRTPTRPIRSSSRPRRRATSSIRASTRPRPRSPARAARRALMHPDDMAGLGLQRGRRRAPRQCARRRSACT